MSQSTMRAEMQSPIGTMARDNWGWFLALGIVFLLGGILALAAPILASITATLMIGVAVGVAGIFQIIHSFRVRTWGGFIWQIALGLLVLIAGIWLVYDPIGGAATLTWILAVIWIAKGGTQIAMGARMRPMSGWGWIVFAGVVSVVVGLIVLLGWPISGLYVPGTLLGISLLFTGWSYVMLALGMRRLA